MLGYLFGQEDLNLTSPDDADMRSNTLFMVELLPPPKADALAALDAGAPLPPRQARPQPFLRAWLFPLHFTACVVGKLVFRWTACLQMRNRLCLHHRRQATSFDHPPWCAYGRWEKRPCADAPVHGPTGKSDGVRGRGEAAASGGAGGGPAAVAGQSYLPARSCVGAAAAQSHGIQPVRARALSCKWARMLLSSKQLSVRMQGGRFQGKGARQMQSHVCLRHRLPGVGQDGCGGGQGGCAAGAAHERQFWRVHLPQLHAAPLSLLVRPAMCQSFACAGTALLLQPRCACVGCASWLTLPNCCGKQARGC